MSTDRFVVRRRGDGWAVVDTEGLMLERRHGIERKAHADAQRLNTEVLKTFGVTWYVEVDATDEADAAKRALKFIAPRWRDGWQPLAVEDMTPTEEN